MHELTLGFIGGGNMAKSLVAGLCADGFPRERIRVADPDPDQRHGMQQHGVVIDSDNERVWQASDVVVFAVKPQILKSVTEALAPAAATHQPLIVSIAAGVRSEAIDRWLGGSHAIVRTMPNTPAMVGSGMSGLYANPQVSTYQRDVAESLMRAVGATLWVAEEAQLDILTALAGSGPAYYFLLMEALHETAVELGLTEEAARLITVETAFGAAKLALEASERPADLRVRVTSKGGTTEQALNVLQQADMKEAVRRAVIAARDRASELAERLGE